MRDSESRRPEPESEPTEAMEARVRASFERQAMMATLGARLAAVQRGRVEILVNHDDRFTQQHGFMHAGAVAAVLDSACGYAAFSVMPPDAAVLTATYTINLLAPAAGELFAITGEVIRAGRTLVVCRGQATVDGATAPFAVMQATLSAVYNRPGITH
ncbi:MAG: PaaI family thioesterase [Streptosporangiaceae bacterium]